MALKPVSNEADLLAKIAKGDQRAFTQLFNHYHKDVLSFSIRLTKSNELALEIVQDIFLKVWTMREQLPAIKSFGGYLSRMVRNHGLNALRQLDRQGANEIHMTTYTPEMADLLKQDTTNQQLDYQDAMALLHSSLEALPTQQRKVYQLCQMESMKYEEAAEALHISVETVRGHMKKALAAVREHFRNHATCYPLLLLAIAN